MPLRFPCPECKASLIAGEQYRGQKVRCKECTKVITVPGEPGPSAKPSASPNEESTSKHAVQARQPTTAARGKSAAGRAEEEERRRPARRDDEEDRPRRRRDEYEDDDDDRPRSRRRRDFEDDERPRRKKAGQQANPAMILLAGGGVFLLIVSLGLGVLLMLRTPARPLAEVDEALLTRKEKEDAREKEAAAKAAPPTAVAARPRAEVPAPRVLPDKIGQDAIVRVKKSTAYLKVETAAGVAEGSGFFCLEPGIVITNAHVLGMMQASSKPPRKVSVFANSGEPDEFAMTAAVLGVDHATDLAVLRVEAEKGKLPEPLPLDHSEAVGELQKVYIFGFPFGATLGKNVTVSESSISSLRKEASGMLKQVQVNGGMHPGNSGGPVVDTSGTVIGVSVAVIKGTQINFAVPGHCVKKIVDGRMLECTPGHAYREQDQVKLPVHLHWLDPLSRISSIELEYWTGNPGNERPYAWTAPAALPGDGQKQVVPVKLEANSGRAEITLPKVEGKQVVWLRPILHRGANRQWAAAIPYASIPTPLERRPASLALKFANDSMHTLKLKSDMTLKVIQSSRTVEFSDEAEFHLLERVKVEAAVNKSTVNIGKGTIVMTDGGKRVEQPPSLVNAVARTIFTVRQSPNGNFLGLELGVIRPNDNTFDPDADDIASRLCNAYQASCMSMPERNAQPMTSWSAKAKMLVQGTSKFRRDPIDLDLLCLYEGMQKENGKDLAFISIKGDLRRQMVGVAVSGKVTGHGRFDIAAGHFAELDMTFVTEADDALSQATATHHIRMTRTPGNSTNIQPSTTIYQPSQPQPAVSVPTGPWPATVTRFPFGVTTELGNGDPSDPRRAQCKAKLTTLILTAGRTYLIDLKSLPGSNVDPLLRLEDAGGQNVLAMDDDGGGFPNARIRFTANTSGPHRLYATCFAPAVGPLVLTITELPGAGQPTLPPNVRPPTMTQPTLPPNLRPPNIQPNPQPGIKPIMPVVPKVGPQVPGLPKAGPQVPQPFRISRLEATTPELRASLARKCGCDSIV